MMRTANPALNDKTFENNRIGLEGEVMTLQGTVNRTGILLGVLLIAAAWIWNQFNTMPDPSRIMPWMWGGFIGAFVVAMIICFKKTWAPTLGPVYAALEGLALGAISAFFERMYPGIVIQAVALTFGTLFALLLAYKSGLIRATENFKLGIVAATGGIMIFYVVAMVLGFFGIQVPLIHSTGIFGIGFSAFVVVIAALNLVLDFDFIENGVEKGAPKFMEWYAAFGLIVTLAWLYIEILRLLSKLQRR